jgi:hypothetical protein
MIKFTAVIKKFGAMGEKTGWFYIDVPAELATRLKDSRQAFRVKGRMDQHKIERVSLVPMGGGDFIIAVNAVMRKAMVKGKGASIKVELELDLSEVTLPDDLMECLSDEPGASEAFLALTKGHRNYYINWINSAKTDPTRARRIAGTIYAMTNGMDYGQMIRWMKTVKGF